MQRLHPTLLALVFIGCASATAPVPATRPIAAPAPAPAGECPCKQKHPPRPPAADDAAPVPLELDHARAAVPVTDADPSWGSRDAPVTLVVWSDFECPFCAQVGDTLAELEQAYGPAQLRVVWKNHPLGFHAHARPAAEAAMIVFALGGDAAFWKFHALAFAGQRQLSPENLTAWAVQAGVDREQFTTAMAARSQQAKVDGDLALGARLGVDGTPAFHINGLALVGALPADRFRTIIDAQLAAAKALVAAGTPARGVYPALCARNLPQAAAPPVETKVWSVPVGPDDPVRGAADSPVTLVLFSDFECPFCKRLQPTLAKLAEKYGADLRIVWKDLPLPGHHQAIPAAVLARLAAATQGPEGFWRAHDALMDSGATLDEAVLKSVADRVGVSWDEMKQAAADRRFQPIFADTGALAAQLGVRGTPCSFVNGQRIDGAMSVEVFVAAIDAQLDKARSLLESGQERAGLYAAITHTPEQTVAFERKVVEGPSPQNPSRGRAKAKVTIQVFGDLECPNTQRLWPILAEVEKKFAGRVRMVWRHRPLLFHANARLAAEAAQEVRAQKGDAAFWRYQELLFAAQNEGGLGRANLEKLAKRLGVDGRRLRAALDSHRHGPVIDRDLAAASKADIVQVPTVLVNDTMVGGVEPGSTYERLIQHALEER